ncbi:MAG: DUF58 domain-containing protein [Pirellulales bacterium]
MEAVQHEFLDPAVLTRLGNLPLCARKPMLGNVSGRHRSPHRGSSIEFAQYRKYVPGDDTRRLDWRAYGRSDRFYVKEYEADTNLRLIAVLDTSGSMRYGRPGCSKLDYAKKLLATLSYLAVQQGDAVGLTCSGEKVHKTIPPRRNPAHLRNVFSLMSELPAEGETGIVEALHAVADQVPQRALIVVVSDLFVEPARLLDCFQHLRYRKHDVSVFHLLEEAELKFDFERPTRFIDLEGGPSLLIEPSLIRREYQTALQQYMSGIDQVVRETALDYHRISIHEDAGDVLARFLLGRLPRRKLR